MAGWPLKVVTLSMSIAHLDTTGERRAGFLAMLRQMGGPRGIEAEVTGWQVTLDTGHGLWGTHRRAWAFGTKAGASHHLVLQNDLILCRDFLGGVKEALRHAPHGPVSFYANRKVIETCRARGSSWARIDDALGSFGQAIAIPVEQVVEFLRFDRTYFRPEVFAYDSRLMLWSRRTGKQVWCTAPSLVQHALPGNSSVGGYSNSKRVARWFIGEDVSALSIDWSKGVNDPPRGAANQPLNWPGHKMIWKDPPPELYSR